MHNAATALARAPADRRLAIAAMLAAACLWGTLWWPLRLVGGHGHDDAGAGQFIIFVAAGMIVLLAMPFWRPRLRAPSFRADLLIAIAFAAATLSWAIGVQLGPVLRTTLLFYLSPVWALIGGWIFFRSPFNGGIFAAVAVGCGGAALVLSGDSGGASLGGASDWLGFFGGVTFAAALLGLERMSLGPTGSITALTLLAGGVMALAALLFLLQPDTTMQWLAQLPAILVGTLWMVSAVWLVLFGAKHVPPVAGALILMIEIAVAAISAAIFAGEALGWREITGSLLVVAAGLGAQFS